MTPIRPHALRAALMDAGAGCILIADIDTRRSTALADRLGKGKPATQTLTALDPTALDPAALDGIVNCTPIGMTTHPGQSFDPTHLARTTWVADCVYCPHATELVCNARVAGLTVMDGTHMALYQMAAAFERFTGIPPDIDRMQRTMASLLCTRA